MHDMCLAVSKIDTNKKNDSIRVIETHKPPGGSDTVEEYNEKKIDAKNEKFKMGLHGSTSTIKQ